MKLTSVGESIPRIDAIDKVTGSAVFGDDMDFSRVLYGKALRSPFARAGIVAVDIREALHLPSVKVIVTGKDIQTLGGEALKDYPRPARFELSSRRMWAAGSGLKSE